MTYVEFKNALINHFSSLLGDTTKLSIHQVIKNNDVLLDALTILSDKEFITPSIYLNGFYEKYLQGESLESIYQEILQIHETNKIAQTQEFSQLLNFNQAKSYIAYKLVNYKENKLLLSDLPHITYLDLAIVFYLLIDQKDLGNATVLIHNNHLKLWDIDTSTLYQLASENTPKLLRAEFISMNNLLSRLLFEELQESSIETQNADEIQNMIDTLSKEDEQMYVLSNYKKYYGAATLLYPDILEHIADQLDNDFFILPSSIHETIIIPFSDRLEKETLQEMVRKINQTEVDQIDRLSDSVYIYSREFHEIQL